MIFQAPREETGKEDQKITCLLSVGQFKYSMGVVLSISGGGDIIGMLSEMQQGLERDGGAKDGAFTPAFQSLWIYGCQGLR